MARLTALVPCLSAQHASADSGCPLHTSRDLVHADVHVLAGAAKHNWSEDFRLITPASARKQRRGIRKVPHIIDTSGDVDAGCLPPPPPPLETAIPGAFFVQAWRSFVQSFLLKKLVPSPGAHVHCVERGCLCRFLLIFR